MTTPARLQYLKIKEQYSEEILFFRMGDFYETFDDDAEIVSRVLEIALTSREFGKSNRIPMAGIPYHALNNYLGRLINKGYKVALCEQVSDVGESKGPVERKVVRVVTAGTVIEDSMLDPKTNNYLAAIVVSGNQAGLSYADITTGQFYTSQIPIDKLEAQLSILAPGETLVNDACTLNLSNTYISNLPKVSESIEVSTEALQSHFKVHSLDSFGLTNSPLAIQAAAGILAYLQNNQSGAVSTLHTIKSFSVEKYMVLDRQTSHNLELFQSGRWGDQDTSLFTVLNKTFTPMGARLLREWISRPLIEIKPLEERQKKVEWFYTNSQGRQKVGSLLRRISDIERLINKTKSGSANPNDLIAIRESLAKIPKIKEILVDKSVPEINSISNQLLDHQEVINLIENSIREQPSQIVGDGKVIKSGYSNELDEVRSDAGSAIDYISRLETDERQRTGIKSLKVSYNKVFGYYIDINKSHISKVPSNYIRRQTLTNSERFITPEMKEYESKVLSAKDKINELEKSVYRKVCMELSESYENVLKTAVLIANIDVVRSLAEVAVSNEYINPKLNNKTSIVVKDGRHPTVEKLVPHGEFVPNDANLSNDDSQLIVLTGPNMSGKSTYIRQVALIVLMAQIGSFVPASDAEIGLVDRIFTRVGLNDDIAVGQSTFMVEMVETASILNQATNKSLIVLDEVGRGTSTYDGLAIAQSIIEYINCNSNLKCRTLFATHYHELISMAEEFPRIKNYNVRVSENQDGVAFLHNIVPGPATRSYGVHVAKLAGLPQEVIKRAGRILDQLESTNGSNAKNKNSINDSQLSFELSDSKLIDSVKSLNLEKMTPLEAITKLYELKDLVNQNDDDKHRTI
ncbi:MAG: DNA mismatch repair protein MutS [Chloroflexota bacterium]|jgi:DNA mismatch repair protein MutS|tara:strand:- start:2937 stop:5516 length:2580 start_codon:yes stop_codon:yes gene_type:complete